VVVAHSGTSRNDLSVLAFFVIGAVIPTFVNVQEDARLSPHRNTNALRNITHDAT
jgi:hypothetical protein